MATVIRKHDLNRNRTTDTFVNGKKYHYFKGDPLLENFVIVEYPSSLAVRRSANGTHPDVLELQRIDREADFDIGGIFTIAEQRNWNKIVFWEHLILNEVQGFLNDANVDTWADARKDDGLAGALRGFGVGWADAKNLAPIIRSVHTSLPGNERSSNPTGSFAFTPGFYVDRSFNLTNNEEFQDISLHSNNIFSGFGLKVVERTANETYNVVLSVSDLSHDGNGWNNFKIPAFQTPLTGTFHVGVWLPEITTLTRNTGTLRAVSVTEPLGIGNIIIESTQRCPGVGLRLEKDWPHYNNIGFGVQDVPGKFRKIFEALG